MVTITDVAKKAGVSVSTVSKVLNGYPHVSEQSKIKVHNAVEELKYVPNAIASALSSKKNARIALWINANNQTQAIDEIWMNYIVGAFSKAEELNVSIIPVFSQMFKIYDAAELARYFHSESVSGIIIYGMNKNDQNLLELIDSQQFNIVVIDAPMVNEKTTSLSIDHAKAQYDVAKKAMENQIHNKVLYIAGKKDGFVTDSRLKGILKLQEELGFDLTIEHADFSEQLARKITFKHAEDHHIIVCASDLMAIGAKNALKESNLYRIVCGYDGISLMGYDGNGIFTVRQNFKTISETAVEEVKNLMDGDKGRKIRLDYEIIQLYYSDIIS